MLTGISDAIYFLIGLINRPNSINRPKCSNDIPNGIPRTSLSRLY